MKKKIEKFRCVICDKLHKDDTEFYIPFYLEHEVVSAKACAVCYADNIQKIAIINNQLYLQLLETKECCEKEIKKSKQKKTKSSR